MTRLTGISAARPTSWRRASVGVVACVLLALSACGFATTQEPAEVTDESAVLRGTAYNTEAGAITHWFEYGPTTDYGASTPVEAAQIVDPDVGLPVLATVTGLDPVTTYHFRLCVKDANGHGTCANDNTFTTDEDSTGTATDFSSPGVVVIAHRGASAYAPEHTFAAYDLAIEQGADYIEQDIQLTADGQLVALHDATLDRTIRGPAEQCSGAVADKTVVDLEACDAGTSYNEASPGRANPAFAHEKIPTMEAVFDRYGTDTRYYIEVKTIGMEEALLELLDQVELDTTDTDLPPVVIQSFSADSLKRIHRLRPELPLVQLISPILPAPNAAALDDISTYAVAIGPPTTIVNVALVNAANERCLDVHPWTVAPSAMAGLLAAGVGGMFTNHPDELVKARDAAPAGNELCAAPATAED